MDNDLKRKIDLVNGYIGKLANELIGQLVGELTDNKGLEKKLVVGLKEIILDNNLKGSDQATSSLIEIISRENFEVVGELAEKTEKAVLELSLWVEKHKDAVVAYRAESSKINSGQETIKTQTLAENVNKVYNNKIEDQTSIDMGTTETTESIGPTYDAPTNTQSVVVLSKEILKEIPKQFENNIGGDQKITTGIADAPQNLVTSGVSLLKNSAKNGLSKLKIGVNDLGKVVFDKAGPSLVNGLNSAVSASNNLTGLLKIKKLAPLLIGFFVVLALGSFLMDTGNTSTLVTGLKIEEESDGSGGGGGVGESPKYGEITYTDDGRIRDCGVGMEADFIRRKHTSRVNPNVLSSGVYDEQLKEAVGEHFGTRCGVVYAAQYLAYDFKYWVPYYWAGKYAKRGLNPRWGAETHPDHSGRIYQGLDCSGFNAWTQYNGYGGRNRGGSAISFKGDCARIKSKIEPGDTLTLGDGSEGTYHIAVVLAYDDKYIKFAHSGGGSGVSTGLIGICSGRLVNGNMTFEYLHHKNYKK